MSKIIHTKGTKLQTHSASLKSLTEKGFMLETSEGEELLTLDDIRDNFLGKEIKITIEEIKREVIEI